MGRIMYIQKKQSRQNLGKFIQELKTDLEILENVRSDKNGTKKDKLEVLKDSYLVLNLFGKNVVSSDSLDLDSSKLPKADNFKHMVPDSMYYDALDFVKNSYSDKPVSIKVDVSDSNVNFEDKFNNQFLGYVSREVGKTIKLSDLERNSLKSGKTINKNLSVDNSSLIKSIQVLEESYTNNKLISELSSAVNSNKQSYVSFVPETDGDKLYVNVKISHPCVQKKNFVQDLYTNSIVSQLCTREEADTQYKQNINLKK